MWRTLINYLFFIIVGLLLACSPKSNYKTLTFFFDGVPNPYLDTLAIADSLPEADSLNGQPVLILKPEFAIHSPYLKKDCGRCHDRNIMGKLLQSSPGLCYQCHNNFTEQYNVLHGPVSSGFCTECHNPHMSKNEKLLLRTGQQLCLYCHSPEDVFNNEAHLDIGETNCTECHNPHGGEDRYIFN